MAKKKIVNTKRKSIFLEIDLECLQQTPSTEEAEKKDHYVSTYLFGKHIVVTKEVYQIHETLDGNIFEILVGLS